MVSDEELRDAVYELRRHPFAASDLGKVVGYTSTPGRRALIERALRMGLIEDSGIVSSRGRRGRPAKLYTFVKPEAPPLPVKRERVKEKPRSMPQVSHRLTKALRSMNPEDRKHAQAAVRQGYRLLRHSRGGHILLTNGTDTLVFKVSANKVRGTKNARADLRRKGISV
jgi:hypothetical protein